MTDCVQITSFSELPALPLLPSNLTGSMDNATIKPLLYPEDPQNGFDALPTTTQLLRTKEIPWDIYMSARLITDSDLQLLRRYDKRDPSLQAKLLEEVGGDI